MADNPTQPGVFTQQEQLQAKHVGTGYPEMTHHEWATNQHRDSIASYLGRHYILEYMALARGTTVARVKYELLKKYHNPCGVQPPKKRKLDEIYENGKS